jgi:hypothetical protein
MVTEVFTSAPSAGVASGQMKGGSVVPAGHVQHTLAFRQLRGVNQQRGPWSENVPGGIEFSCLASNPPLLRLANVL